MSMNRQDVYEQAGVAATCRGYEEYQRMFDLPDQLEGKHVLDIAGGASSFTADCSGRGIYAQAVDPRYAYDPEIVLADAREEIETSTEKLRSLAHRFDWSYYGGIDQHRTGRLESFHRFAADYSAPDAKQRYIAGSLPALPFADRSFDLVLCSHFLFLYADQFDADFHERAVLDMIRICRPGGQVRIYPLLSLRWEPYPHMNRLLAAICNTGAVPSIEDSLLPFIPKSSKMLVVNV
ncbi:methyltransferase family protein [Paenibacillus cellulosilyticus]|uniref:Methyltransferase family protein n=1 Tax=Paenibacillus cellulosilyticus TaxID=375489 RepID=A0A2V2Z036_9BACL|nr:methyltransferase domain-containing protein [Paenibacillus cellulosilyticus]PWV99672.1 methyltransferase family protein [Paenibacillus cellulosilyticus]QKS44891.1 class I SAM-dependent methyltransferase [Paenibacillus cellulosilyticus]